MQNSNIRATLKLGSLLLVMIVLLVPYLVSYPLGRKTRRFFSYPFFRYCLTCAGLKIKVVGRPNRKRGKLYISNHVSYLDIPVLATIADGLFIAKSDVADWPVIGFLAKIGRTYFVSRKVTDIFKERLEIADRLENGQSVFLFPEGSSSNGHDILPFKPGLLSCALLPSGKNDLIIQPLTINYAPDFPNHKRELYAWYDDMELAPHIWALLRSNAKATVTLEFHQCRQPADFMDRKSLAKWAEGTIKSGLTKVKDKQRRPRLDAAI